MIRRRIGWIIGVAMVSGLTAGGVFGAGLGRTTGSAAAATAQSFPTYASTLGLRFVPVSATLLSSLTGGGDIISASAAVSSARSNGDLPSEIPSGESVTANLYRYSGVPGGQRTGALVWVVTLSGVSIGNPGGGWPKSGGSAAQHTYHYWHTVVGAASGKPLFAFPGDA